MKIWKNDIVGQTRVIVQVTMAPAECFHPSRKCLVSNMAVGDYSKTQKKVKYYNSKHIQTQNRR